MRQASITSYLGPALVLYLVADVASGRGVLGPIGAAMATTAVLLSLAPLIVSRDAGLVGALRLAWLGVSAGLSLVRYVDPHQMSLTADLSRAVGTTLMGTIVLELSVSVPDRVIVGERWGRRLAWLLGGSSMGLLLASLLPPVPLAWSSSEFLIVPPLHRWAGEAYLAVCLVLSLAARMSRRALRSSPEALASNAWGTLCLVPSATCAGFGGVLAMVGQPLSSAHVGIALAIVSALLVFGHARLLRSDGRLRAGSAARSVVALGVTVLILCGAAALLLPYVPRTRLAFGFAMAATLFAGLSLHRALLPTTEVLFSPYRGALLRAIVDGMPDLVGSRRLEDLGRLALGPLRRAAGDVSTVPRMYFFEPPLELRIDAAGQAHLDNRELNPAIAERLRRYPGELIMRGPLERLIVREPTLRGLIEGLVHLDALCVVPMLSDGEPEGALVLPRGPRRSALTLEETEALRDFAQRVAAQATILLAEARAQRRAGEALRAARRAEERLELLTDEVRRLRSDAVVLRAGRAAQQLHVSPIAYSEAMRRLLSRLDAVATGDAPVLLQAEGGTPIQPLAFRLHEASGRAGEAFVIGDCAAASESEGGAALFGTAGESPTPGWLRLATGGTLVLLDVPALGRAQQVALAEALATRVAQPDEGSEPYKVTARVVACAREDLESLAAAGCFEVELAQRLSACRLDVPALRRRAEDLESIILLAIDRGCRQHGKPPVGLEPDARTALMEYNWPGNHGELLSVIERAVGRCEGRRIALSDLPDGIAHRGGASDEALAGTLAAIERRALARALDISDGNKSEAARLLGLKRTTFLDKLRRYHLDDAGRPRETVSH